MAFTATDVKNLREMTGVGMMDCKKALTASNGDMDKAVEYLRPFAAKCITVWATIIKMPICLMLSNIFNITSPRLWYR